MALLGAWMLLAAGCVSTPDLTATIHDSHGWVIRLASTSEAADRRAYAHPTSLSVPTMVRLLRGLYLYLEQAPSAAVGGAVAGSRVFSEDDVDPLARFLVEGLRRASASEIVTFVRTVPVSSRQTRTSSGAVFIVDGALHVVLANHRVKLSVWNDLEAYEAPIYTQPLHPVVASPGRLVFDRAELMDPVPKPERGVFWRGLPWHVAVRYQALAGG